MHILAVISCVASLLSGPPDTSAVPVSRVDLCNDVIGVCHPVTHQPSNFVFDKQIYQFGCDTLSQVRFWRQIMNTHQDTFLVNIADNRKIVRKVSNDNWKILPDSVKECFRDSIRKTYGLSDSARILLTGGKSFFYNFDNAYINFDKGIQAFIDNGVDPWYAQAILLIESPNKLQKSNVGAYGPFQLMKDVARLFGLKVNRQVDERADFNRSAYAASSLIKTICIPKTRQMLDSLHIPYKENELWFRLLVMHSYHAGAGNVKKALFSFMPTEGGMGLVYTLWRTETKHFRSASQNYSQLVLAAMLEMNQRLLLRNPQQEANSTGNPGHTSY
ncbi:MAG: transglycosylase SLT domain-containing protein [Bacteroidetes bacterium]|nr:transglycosylase SLT domain-containing protein [Bacteroidota bacterium]